MIDYATDSLVQGLKTLWMECFGDGAAYTDYLFSRLLLPEHILVSTGADGMPEAMLCTEPFELLSQGLQTADGAYIYGVATRPDRQGRGLSTALLDECHKRLRDKGVAASVLVPASDSLFGFYQKRGYDTAFYIQRPICMGSDLQQPATVCTVTPVTSLSRLAEQRDGFYADRSMYVRWGPRYLDYIGDECRLLGGEVLALSCGGRQGYAVCYPHQGSVIVKELTLPADMLDAALYALHALYGATGYRVYLPADTTECANKVLPFAMVQWYDREKQAFFQTAQGQAPWIAHVLD